MTNENEAREMRHCGRGSCVAMGGHEGTCAEASGWEDAAKAEPLNVDREVLIAGLRTDAGDYALHMQGTPMSHELSWDERNVRAWNAAEALSAQEAATEVEDVQWAARIGDHRIRQFNSRALAEERIDFPLHGDWEWPRVLVTRTVRATAWEEAK